MKILGDYEAAAPSDAATNTARDGVLWTSRVRNHNRSAQPAHVEDGKEHLALDVTALQTFGTPPEDAAGTDLNCIITPSLGKINPFVLKQ